jgi:regulator of nucleoside diphosphate kinase
MSPAGEPLSKKLIYLTEFDFKRLKNLLDAGSARFPMDGRHLRGIKEELDKAVIVPPAEIPADVITMNSRIRLVNLNTGEETVFALVFPGDANIDAHKISVLAPIGTAVLGFRVGDIIQWEVPAGTARFKVAEVLYQPEAAGNFQE